MGSRKRRVKRIVNLSEENAGTVPASTGFAPVANSLGDSLDSASTTLLHADGLSRIESKAKPIVVKVRSMIAEAATSVNQEIQCSDSDNNQKKDTSVLKFRLLDIVTEQLLVSRKKHSCHLSFGKVGARQSLAAAVRKP